jgi:N-acetylmuramoyl-L-alanine amidase
MPELKGMLNRCLSPDEFRVYARTELKRKIKVWRPRGFVLHNTGLNPSWTDKTTPAQAVQLVKNMSVTWASPPNNWSSGPHIVNGKNGQIVLAWPMWMPGTHSRSYNQTFWALEQSGDYDKEPFPDAQLLSSTIIMAEGYALLGHEPSDDSFHLHKEDARTTHKHCPGVNCGTKAQWIKRITDEMHRMNPGDLAHVA